MWHDAHAGNGTGARGLRSVPTPRTVVPGNGSHFVVPVTARDDRTTS